MIKFDTKVRSIETLNNDYIDPKRYDELLGFKYDLSATTTRSINRLMKDRRGICFDFVNYLYYKNNGYGDCYFIYFNNERHSTHTFYFINGYLIEATPNPNEPLNDIYIAKMSLKDNIESLVSQNVDMKNLYNKNDPPYDLIKYTPDNKEISIKSFICKRLDEAGVKYK